MCPLGKAQQEWIQNPGFAGKYFMWLDQSRIENSACSEFISLDWEGNELRLAFVVNHTQSFKVGLNKVATRSWHFQILKGNQ